MARTTDPEKKTAAADAAARKRAAAELRERLGLAPGRSLVDELIAERRAIGRAEEADYSQRQDGDD